MKITVFGTPGPQGSKRFMGVRGGRGVLVESSAKVKPWREAVKFAALEVMEQGELSIERMCNGGIPGPVTAEMIFTVKRPKSAKRGAVPATRPDLSKLVRSTEDALTDVLAWEDDSRVVRVIAMKVYPGEHPDALNVPGAVIRIRRYV